MLNTKTIQRIKQVDSLVSQNNRAAEAEANLRAVWNSQGVSQERQAELLKGPHASCGESLAKAFGLDKLPADLITIIPDKD